MSHTDAEDIVNWFSQRNSIHNMHLLAYYWIVVVYNKQIAPFLKDFICCHSLQSGTIISRIMVSNQSRFHVSPFNYKQWKYFSTGVLAETQTFNSLLGWPNAIIVINECSAGALMRRLSFRSFEGELHKFRMHEEIPIEWSAYTIDIVYIPPSIQFWNRSASPSKALKSTATTRRFLISCVNPVFPFWRRSAFFIRSGVLIW